jgi:hypothetical protein
MKSQSRPPDSRSFPDSRSYPDSKAFPDSQSAGGSRAQFEAELDLKRELLRVVLAKTLKRNGVPPQWVGAEINAMNLPSGELRIELRLSLQVDEPRFTTYLSTFQSELEHRLLAIAPDARQWVSGIVWTLTTDAAFERALPTPEYWAHVIADRELTARQQGTMDWDRDALARHFVDTDPGDLVVDFDDTKPPDRDVENLAPPKKD